MSPEIIKKPSNLGAVYLIVPLIIVVAFIFSFQKEDAGKNKNTEDDKTDCIVSMVNTGGLAALSAEEMAEEINQKPLCRDVCIEQIKNSKKNPDWQASNDIRNTCEEIGLPLPVR